MGDRSRKDGGRALWGSGISVAKIRSRGRRRKGPNYVTWVVCSWATRDRSGGITLKSLVS